MKKIIAVLLVICVFATVFGATAKSTGLTESDVKSFCKNFSTIYKELDKLGVNVKNADKLSLDDKVVKEAGNILNKSGISGKNAVEKLKSIVYGYAVSYYDDALSKDKTTADALKKSGIDMVSNIRNLVSDKDKAVVQKHLSELTTVLKNYTESVSSKKDANAYEIDTDAYKSQIDKYSSYIDSFKETAGKTAESAASDYNSAVSGFSKYLKK